MLNRSRRLRTSAAMRNLVAETDLRPRHLIQPHFVQPHAGSSDIASLPGITAGPFRDDVTLPTAKGVRFDFGLEDPDLGTLQVSAYLFRFGEDAYLVCFVAPAETFEDAIPMFDAIADSLRFGV